MSLSDVQDALDSKIINSENQSESIQDQINKWQSEQDSYKQMMDVIDSRLRSYTIDSTSEENFFHSYGEYYPRTIDSTSDMTSWIVFTYLWKSYESQDPITLGIPTEYDSTGSGATCYLDSSSLYFYFPSDSTGGLYSNIFTQGQNLISQNDSTSNIVYINILCKDNWNRTSDNTWHLVIRYSILQGQTGQTVTTFTNPLSFMEQNYWYNGGPNWNSLSIEKRTQILKYSSDFWYTLDNIFLPIGLTGTYGTKDNIAKLQLGLDIQTKNKEKYEAGQTVFDDYV